MIDCLTFVQSSYVGIHPGEYSGLDQLRAHLIVDLDKLKDSGSNDWGPLHLFFVAQNGNYYSEDCYYRRLRIVAREKTAAYLGLPKVAEDPDGPAVDLYQHLSVAGIGNSIKERQPDLVWDKLAELFGLHWETHESASRPLSQVQGIASFLAILLGRPCMGFLTGDMADSTTEEQDKVVDAGDDGNDEEDKDDDGETPESRRENVLRHAAYAAPIDIWLEEDTNDGT